MSTGQPSSKKLSARGKSFAVVATRWNESIVEKLLAGAVETLRESGAEIAGVHRCAGVFELAPLCARIAQRAIAGSGSGLDGIIAIGCLIRGGTDHYSLLASETTRALGSLSMELATAPRPIALAFGVLTCENDAQAEERADKGREAALACIEQALALGEP